MEQNYYDQPQVNPIIYSEGFKRVVEDHLQQIIQAPETKAVAIAPQDKRLYLGDFYLFIAKKHSVVKPYWHITLRVNGLTSPTDYHGQLDQIILPSPVYIDRLLTQYMTINSTV